MTDQELINNFKKCFDGYEKAYGQHCDLEKSHSGKVNGKAISIANMLRDDIILKHLNGKGNSLGMFPLKENLTVKFGAIDIDGKHQTNPRKHTIEELEEKVRKLALPLIPCQSKSGDVHLYCFTKEEVPARLLVSRLKEWAGLIGYGNVEIFPKQTTRLNDKDMGNWINLPYFDHEKTNRFAINKGKKINIEEFFSLVEAARISKDELQNFKYENLDENYNDAPPCLQTLASIGVNEGSRNNGLYNFAVYFKKKFPDDFESKTANVNDTIFSPKLGWPEVQSVIKSVNKKDFFYKCNEEPICQFCVKTECSTRKFGVGGFSDSEELAFDGLTKYVSDDSSVRWYANVKGIRVQFTTDELLNQKLLQRKILDATNKLFQMMKAQKWEIFIANCLKTCEVYQDPAEASEKGVFKEYFNAFCCDGSPSQSKDALAKNNLYLNEKENMLYFKAPSLFEYLKSHGLKHSPQDIWHWVKELGAEHVKMRSGNTSVRAWKIKMPERFSETDEDLV